MKKISSLVWLAIGVLPMILLGAVSCKQAAEKQQEKTLERAIEQSGGGNADVDVEDGKVTIESGEGKIEIKTGDKKWPTDAPKEAPELKVGKIVGTLTSETPEGRHWTIRYEGIENSELEKYGAILKNGGFKITTIKSSKGGMLTGEKDNLIVVFTVSPEVSMVAINAMNN